MKKKGLIISTVVMVVVLIASLTTATYAWFTAGSTVSVNDITMSVVAGSDVAIGMAKTNAYKADATMDDFVNGSLTWDGAAAEKWTGDKALSSTLNTNLPAIQVSKAISTAVKVGENYTVDATQWVEANEANVVRASGNGATAENSSAEAAIMNAGKEADGTTVKAGDYISLAMGVQAVAPNLKSIGCVITVEPTGNKATLGMNAAIHVRYRLNGGNWQEADIYGNIHYTTPKSSTSIVNANPNVVMDTDGTTPKNMTGAQSIKIDVEGSDTNTTALTGEKINQLEIVVFIAGYDSDCNNASMGSSALIHINFVTDVIAA